MIDKTQLISSIEERPMVGSSLEIGEATKLTIYAAQYPELV